MVSLLWGLLVGMTAFAAETPLETCGQDFAGKNFVFRYVDRGVLWDSHHEGVLQFSTIGAQFRFYPGGQRSFGWELNAESFYLFDLNGSEHSDAYSFQRSTGYIRYKRSNAFWGARINNLLYSLHETLAWPLKDLLEPSDVDDQRLLRLALACSYRMVLNTVVRGQENLLKDLEQDSRSPSYP